MAFKNRIRLPIIVDRPQYKETRDAYRRADGKTIIQSVSIQKIYAAQTDWMPEAIHEAFKIALASDTTTIETDKYFGDVVQNGDYQINWPDRFMRDQGPAEFKLEVSPFDATNSNCQTCEDAMQLSLVDDDISMGVYGIVPLNEGSTTVKTVINNDSICCYPVEFSIIYYNTDVVASAAISSLGVVTVVLKTPIADYSHLKIATYRATCPNGGYDEADIYADINGSLVNCVAPSGLFAYLIGNDNAPLQWVAASPVPAGGYHIEVFDVSNPGSPVFTGDTAATNIVATGLTPGTNYIAYVHSVCAPPDISNDIQVSFITTGTSGGGGTPVGVCGRYKIQYSDPASPGSIVHVSYKDCSGNDVNTTIFNGSTFRYICALEYSPGDPYNIYIEGSSQYAFIQYIEPC